MSLELTGQIAGYKQNPRQSNGKEWIEHVVGVTVPAVNGFEGQTDLVLVKLDKKHVDLGLGPLYQNLRGRSVRVPVYVRAFPTRGGAGYEFHLSGDGRPAELTPPKAG